MSPQLLSEILETSPLATFIPKEYGGFGGNSMVIYVDKETGVNYLFSSCGYAGGMTPLLNRDGTPVVTPIPKTYEE